jgi:hypothetical protein
MLSHMEEEERGVRLHQYTREDRLRVVHHYGNVSLRQDLASLPWATATACIVQPDFVDESMTSAEHDVVSLTFL